MLHRSAFGSTDLSVANRNSNANPPLMGGNLCNSPIVALDFVDKTLLWTRPGLDTMIVNLHHDFFEAVVSVSKSLVAEIIVYRVLVACQTLYTIIRSCQTWWSLHRCVRLGGKIPWTCVDYSGTWWCQRCDLSSPRAVSLVFRPCFLHVEGLSKFVLWSICELCRRSVLAKHLDNRTGSRSRGTAGASRPQSVRRHCVWHCGLSRRQLSRVKRKI